jgi:8-oxo-dGTP pyrophosphatase MutT (NUDIX family)
MTQVIFETPTNFHNTQHKCWTRQNPIICCNCGGVGHVYARCNHPVTSYGIICYRLTYNKSENRLVPEYLMVQRKDSLSFVEFMRGKYDVKNLEYLMKLFSNMIEEERNKIISYDFEELWKELWQDPVGKNFFREYNSSKEKFELLQKGFYLKTEKKGLLRVSLDYIVENTTPKIEETEWGFPKGRRNFSNEDDHRCALREFKEETGIYLQNIQFVRDLKPFEEIFTGSNKVRYKHVYYIAKYSPFPFRKYNVSGEYNKALSKHQAKEIKDVKWYSYDEAQKKIREHNIERKELLKRVNSVILKSCEDLYNHEQFIL